MKIGETVGKYKIVEVLGEGGMGVVYKAWEESLSRYVAIKSFKIDELDSLDFFKRFLSEAKIVAQIKHPTMVAIYEINTSDKVPYIAMEFLEGKNLQDKAKSEKLTIEYIIKAVEKLAEGFQAVHQSKILHRDIKPANIFVTDNGEFKILDFGISKWEKDPNAAETVANQFIGTITYCAPEIFHFKSQSIQSDIFSLGVTAIYMLILESVFKAEDPSGVVEKIQFEDVQIPEQMARQFPRVFIDLLLEMVEKDPQDRPESMLKIAERCKAIRKTTSQNMLERNLIRESHQATLNETIEIPTRMGRSGGTRVQTQTKRPSKKTKSKKSASIFHLFLPYTAAVAAITFGVLQFIQKKQPTSIPDSVPIVKVKQPVNENSVKPSKPKENINDENINEENINNVYSNENARESELVEDNQPSHDSDLFSQVKSLLAEGKAKGLTFDVLENNWIPEAERALANGYTDQANQKLQQCLQILKMRVAGNIPANNNFGSQRPPRQMRQFQDRPRFRENNRNVSSHQGPLKAHMDLIEDIREQVYNRRAPNEIRVEVGDLQKYLINSYNQNKTISVENELNQLKEFANNEDWEAFQSMSQKIKGQLQ